MSKASCLYLHHAHELAKFRLNGPSAPLVNVTVSHLTQTYIYNPTDLFYCYGIGLLCTLLCLALGINAIIKNRSTFSNNFSSILRSTRNSELNTIIHAADFSASDPLPKRMASSTIKHHLPEDGIAGFKLVSPHLHAMDRRRVRHTLLP